MSSQNTYKVTVVGTIYRELLGVYKTLDHGRPLRSTSRVAEARHPRCSLWCGATGVIRLAVRTSPSERPSGYNHTGKVQMMFRSMYDPMSCPEFLRTSLVVGA